MAINRLAARFAFPLGRGQVDFRPDPPATEVWRRQVVERSLAGKQCDHPPPMPTGRMSRGEFARKWWKSIAKLPETPFKRLDPLDADQDGLPDTDDALPLDAENQSWPAEDKLQAGTAPPED